MMCSVPHDSSPTRGKLANTPVALAQSEKKEGEMMLKGRAVRTICAGILILTIAGCASTQQVRSNDQVDPVPPSCTSSTVVRDYFSLPLKFQQQAFSDCRDRNPIACMAAPLAIPYTGLMVVFGAPVLLPLLMWANDNRCSEPGTTQTEMSASDVQQTGIEPPLEQGPSSAELR